MAPTLPMVATVARFPAAKLGLWATRALLLLWAGFWLWFNIASAIGEHDGLKWHLGLAGILIGLAAIGWFWARVGGVLMITVGMLAAWGLHNMGAYTTLALPAAAIGVLMLLIGSTPPEPRSPAAP